MAQLQKGDKAPAFALQDQDGVVRTLAEFAGRRLVVYFYPKADTPGCTKQGCAVRDKRQDWGAAGVAVVGISPDAPKAQKKFDAKYSLGFPLLADTENQVAQAYGVWGEKSMYGKTYMGIIRSAFLIDTDGTIEGAWYKVSPDDTVPAIQEALGTRTT